MAATPKKPSKKDAVAPTAPARPRRSESPAATDRGTATTPEQRRQLIAVAAYYAAERRGFLDGDATADWLAAEAEIDRLLATGALNHAEPLN